MVQVTVINGSPRKENGNTAFVLKPFIEGMRKAGGNVKVFYPSQMALKPCLGNLECWGETKEKCIIMDEMQDFYPILKESDILILASPVYIPLPSKMQNFINRLCPLLNPKLKWEKNRTRIQFHDDVKIQKIGGVIVGGWWEIENLEIVSEIFKEVANISSIEFIGSIRRPHAYKLKEETDLNRKIWASLESVGKHLIEKGNLDQNDLEFISQPLIVETEYRKYLNEVHK